MKNKLLFLIVCIGLLIKGYSVEAVREYPSETVILKLSDNKESNWKEITHHINKKSGTIESIPLNQKSDNWSELICIQYYDTSIKDIEKILDLTKKESFFSYFGQKVFWEVIEKTKSDAIYEMILSSLVDEKVLPEHEISRIFLTKTGLHRVAFTKKNGKMTSEERNQWIKLLRENASVISFQDGFKSNGLSMANKFKNSLSLGINFQDWITTNTFSYDNGLTMVCYVPSTQATSYVTECLEIVTTPNVQELSVDQFFEREKNIIQERFKDKINFQVLQQSPREIIYTCVYPQDHLQVNSVVRLFITDQGYYAITYKRGLEKLIEKEETLKWMEKLKSITVKLYENYFK